MSEKPTLSPAAIEARREYHRKWYAKNKEERNKYHRKWYSQHREERLAYNKRYWERMADKQDTERTSEK